MGSLKNTWKTQTTTIDLGPSLIGFVILYLIDLFLSIDLL